MPLCSLCFLLSSVVKLCVMLDNERRPDRVHFPSHIDSPTSDHYTLDVLAREDESGPLRQKIPNRVRA